MQASILRTLGATSIAVAIHGGVAAQTTLPPDPFGLRAIQHDVISTIDLVRPATVAVRTRGTGRGFATGVLIDHDLVLTAGHVGQSPDRSVTITLSDGRIFKGTTLGQVYEHDVDLGLIRLDTHDDTVPFLEPALNNSIEKGEWVIMLGHAAMMRNTDTEVPIPAARVGRVLRLSGPRLEVDAPFDSGDSGGPVVDLEGRIIGIVSRCGFHPWQNFATNAGAIRRTLEDMLANPDEIQITQIRPEKRHPRSIEESKRDPNLHEALLPYVWSVAPSIVRVMEKDRVVSTGTVVDHELVLTKASLFARQTKHPLVIGANDDEPRPARLRAIDARLDLALLEVDGLDAPPVTWGNIEVDAGQFLIIPSENGDVRSIGAIARERDSLALDQMDRPFMGIAFREHRNPSGLRITAVTASTPAKHAGVHEGDILLKADGKKITDRASIRAVLDTKKLGETLLLVFFRDKEEVSIQLPLGIRSPSEQQSLPSNTAMGTSRISSGFGEVILCDASASPHQLTVPVVDLNGAAVGLTIARRSRTATVVLESDRVQTVVKALKAKTPLSLKEATEAVAAYQTIHTVDSDGVLTLQAEEAFPRGDLLRRERRDDTRTTWGFWADGDDALEWNAIIDQPGRYTIMMVHSCRYRTRGTPIRCTVGEAYVDATVKSSKGNGDFDAQELGTVTIESPGEFLISLKPLGSPIDTVTNFARLIFVRQSTENE